MIHCNLHSIIKKDSAQKRVGETCLVEEEENKGKLDGLSNEKFEQFEELYNFRRNVKATIVPSCIKNEQFEEETEYHHMLAVHLKLALLTFEIHRELHLGLGKTPVMKLEKRQEEIEKWTNYYDTLPFKVRALPPAPLRPE